MKQTANSNFGTGTMGVGWSGEIYQDTVAFESDPDVMLDFVSITAQSNFFQPGSTCGGKEYQGIAGFDRSTVELTGTDGFFDAFVKAKGVPNIFATKFCDDGGTLWLGGFDSTATTSPPQYTPVTKDFLSQAYYTVDLESITVGAVNAAPDAGTADAGTSDAGTTDAGSSPAGNLTVAIASASYKGTVVDTGTSVFLLGTTAYDALTTAIAGTPGFQKVFGSGSNLFAAKIPCASVTQTKAELDAILPPLTMTFGSGATAITVQALATESYLAPNSGEWCAALYSQAQSQGSFPFAAIMGAPMLRANVVIFDRVQNQIGFASHTPCAGAASE